MQRSMVQWKAFEKDAWAAAWLVSFNLASGLRRKPGIFRGAHEVARTEQFQRFAPCHPHFGAFPELHQFPCGLPCGIAREDRLLQCSLTDFSAGKRLQMAFKFDR